MGCQKNDFLAEKNDNPIYFDTRPDGSQISCNGFADAVFTIIFEA